MRQCFMSPNRKYERNCFLRNCWYSQDIFLFTIAFLLYVQTKVHFFILMWIWKYNQQPFVFARLSMYSKMYCMLIIRTWLWFYHYYLKYDLCNFIFTTHWRIIIKRNLIYHLHSNAISLYWQKEIKIIIKRDKIL